MSRSSRLRTCLFIAGLLAGPATSWAAPTTTLTPATLAARDLLDVAPAGITDSTSAGDLTALRRRLAEIVALTGVPGAAVVLIAPDGTLLTEALGRASPGVALSTASLFRMGSLTKSFIALAIMRLCERGKLRLDAHVRDLAPELAIDNRFEATHPLTVAHLLEHTAGFDEMRFNEIFDAEAAASGHEKTIAEILAVNPRSRITRWPPGTRFSYSQPGYTTAAYLIEKVSGRPYAAFLADEVFGPLGIKASVRLDPATRARLASGHDHGQPIRYVHLLHRPAMNLMISIEGVARLLALMLGRGTLDGRRFLSPTSIARIERSETLAYGPPTVRYGLGNWGDVSAPVPLRGHGGFMPGYAGTYRYSSARGFGFAVLVNDSSNWESIGRINVALLQFVLRGQPLPPRPLLPQPRAVLARHVGHYQMRAPEIEFLRYQSDVYDSADIDLRGETLWLRRPGDDRARPLVPTGPDRFRFMWESDASIEFLRGSDDRRAVVVGATYYEEEPAWLATARRIALELSVTLLLTTIFVPFYFLLRRDREEVALLGRPLLAALCLLGMAQTFQLALDAAALGARTPATIALWLFSLGFGLCSYAAFGQACLGSTEVPRFLRRYALAVSLAGVWVTLHLSRYGLIGLRTWLW